MAIFSLRERMFVDLVNLMLETEDNVKQAKVRGVVFSIMAQAALQYGQEHGIKALDGKKGLMIPSFFL